MLCYVETVIVPHVEVIIESLGVQSNHCALVILNEFCALLQFCLGRHLLKTISSP